MTADRGLSRVAPLGVRFVDDRTGAAVAEGLVVTCWPAGEPSRRRLARANGSSVFSLHDVPGLGDVERGTGDDAYFRAAPRRPFVLDVEDRDGRFLPFRVMAELPARGLLPFTCGPAASPPGPDLPGGIPLFTAPTRPAAPGSAVLRADLWDPIADAPAAWAVVQARVASAAGRAATPRWALADDLGRLALHVPCPDDDDLDGGSFASPSGPAPVPLAARTWTVELTAAYRPPPSDPRRARHPRGAPVPDLCAALMQPPATLWTDRARTTPVQRASLTYGRDTVLRSIGGARPPSVLFVTPGSPP